MSVESQSGSFTPEFQYMYAFPLSEKAVGDGIAWFSYVTSRKPEFFEVEKRNAERLDPTLFKYLEHMHELRGEIHLSDEQMSEYMNGAIFGVNVLANQYQHVGLVLPPVNEAAQATYFKSLITDHEAFKNNDPQYNILVTTQPGMIKSPITPSQFYSRIRSSASDPLLKEVQIKFKANSAEALERMWNSEPALADAIPAITNMVDVGKRGFFLGILDVYAPFKMDHVVGPYVEVLDTFEF